MKKRVLITGGAGFIGSHLATRLRAEGCEVYTLDIARHEFFPELESTVASPHDLRARSTMPAVLDYVRPQEVYHLAADMGGIGYIENNVSSIARNNSLINLNTLNAVIEHSKKVPVKFLYSSSACIYPRYRQNQTDVTPLTEDAAYPAEPERGYGWEKLYMEQLCDYARVDNRVDVRVVRFHNVYGPRGCWTGGKEKSPAAACRKIAELPSEGGEVEIWGDGEQTRSYMYIDDCVEGLIRLMASGYPHPLNLGRDEMVTINQLFDAVGEIACKKFSKRYNFNAPQGVRGRNSDNRRLRHVLEWEPQISLEEGLRRTYPWIEEQVKNLRGQ